MMCAARARKSLVLPFLACVIAIGCDGGGDGTGDGGNQPADNDASTGE
jgi:hypothetical protein